MSLRESPFPNAFLEGVHAVGWGLIFPCFWFLDRLIAGCMSTSLERRLRREAECYLHPLKVAFGSVLFLVLFIISAPFALLGFVLWAPLQAARRPFSYRQHVPTVAMENRNARWEETGKLSFGFATANLCLLPDGIARFNNLGHAQRRAAVIGHIIVQGVTRPHIRIFVDSPSSCGTLTPSSSLLPQAAASSYGAVESVGAGQAEGVEPDGDVTSVASSDVPGGLKQHPQPPKPNCNQNSNQHVHPPRTLRTLLKDSDVPMEVSSLFPSSVDVVCLQEVFDKRAALKLMRTLGPLYGHIIYDVGVYACYPVGTCSSFKFFNSGLFLASRFPVTEAQFHCFPNGCGEDALAAKGLLCVKVDIGLQKGEKRMVGYINCTHLHAPEGDGEIRFEQLNMLTKWIREFQAVTKQDNEMVMFDVLCGDFNFDNCSPDDRLEQSHSVFEEYRDPCRAGAGQEKPWVIGTLLEQPTLYHEDVATLENLQRTLENEEQRRHFISPPVPLRGVSLDYPEPGQPWVGRRIDYLLYRESSVSSHSTTEVEEFTYVTQLAGLTDHIPVSFRLNVTLDSEM